MPTCLPEQRHIALRKRLQTPANEDAALTVEDRAPEQSEWAEPHSLPSDRPHPAFEQEPVNRPRRVTHGDRHSRLGAPRPVDAPQRSERDDSTRVGERCEAQAVVGRQDKPPSRAENPCHLSYGDMRRMQPRYDPDGDDETVTTGLERQGMGIRDSDVNLPPKVCFAHPLICELCHRGARVDGIDTQPKPCKLDREMTGATPDLEHGIAGVEISSANTVKHRCLTLPVDEALDIVVAVNCVPVRCRSVEMPVDVSLTAIVLPPVS